MLCGIPFNRIFCILFVTSLRTPLHKIILLFYLLVLFSITGYLFGFGRVSYVKIFGRIPPSPTHSFQRELLQIQIVFKHGHRAPFRIYETDPNPKELWKEGLGQVTIIGRRQLYNMGQHLRERYRGFITSNPNEIQMHSSDAFRSMRSAYCLLAGMYPPDEEWMIASNFPWQPIMVTYVNEVEDNLLQSNPNCPKYEACKKRVKMQKDIISFNEEHKPFYEFWQQHSRKSVSSCDGSADLYKTLSVERDSNLTIPDWALKYWDELVYQTDVSYYNHFKTKLQQRLRAGPILGLIFERMMARIAGNNADIKVYGYSGHGSNTAAIQCALLSYDMRHSPHAATLVFELYEEHNGSHTVRFVSFNSTHPEERVEEPFIFKLPGCTEYCPIEYFGHFLEDLVPRDWESECKEPDDEDNDYVPEQSPEYFLERKYNSASSNFQKFHHFLLCILLFTLIKFML